MSEELLSNSMAAQALSEELHGRTAEEWAGWLQNNRNQSRRVPYRIPFQRISGGIFYARGELEKFIEFEKGRQLGSIKLTGRAAQVAQAFGIGTDGASTNGRKWKGGSANLATSEGRVFVQVVINEPLMVFDVTPEQAIEHGREMMEAGRAALRQSSPADMIDYKTVADDQDVQIRRKGKS